MFSSLVWLWTALAPWQLLRTGHRSGKVLIEAMAFLLGGHQTSEY